VGRSGALGRRRTDCLAVCDALEPTPALSFVSAFEPVFDETEVRPQDLRQVRVSSVCSIDEKTAAA